MFLTANAGPQLAFDGITINFIGDKNHFKEDSRTAHENAITAVKSIGEETPCMCDTAYATIPMAMFVDVPHKAMSTMFHRHTVCDKH